MKKLVDCDTTWGRLAVRLMGSFFACKPRRPVVPVPEPDPDTLGADAAPAQHQPISPATDPAPSSTDSPSVASTPTVGGPSSTTEPQDNSEPQSPEPEPEPIVHPTAPVRLDFAQDWTLFLIGKFFSGEKSRIVRNGGINDGLDIFFWSSWINLRLWNGRIYFTDCAVGNGYAIGRQNDHWAATNPLPVNLKEGQHELLLGYTVADRRFRVWIDKILVADFGFEIRAGCPVRTELKLIGFRGRVVQTVPLPVIDTTVA